MTTITTPSSLALVPSLEMAWQDVDSSFERFCLTAGRRRKNSPRQYLNADNGSSDEREGQRSHDYCRHLAGLFHLHGVSESEFL
jgi:hypothetical protein